MAFTLDAGVFGTVLQDKWDKTKGIIFGLCSMLEKQGERFKHLDLLSDRGFLIYVARTYKTMRPYLKGFNLTID